jgi:hypothetical protein
VAVFPHVGLIKGNKMQPQFDDCSQLATDGLIN